MSDVYGSGGQSPWGAPPPQWGPPPAQPGQPQWGPPQPGPPPWGPPPSGRGGLSGLAWTGIAIAVTIVGALFAVAVLRVFASGGSAFSATSCQQSAPAGASPAAVSYMNALNTGYVGWTQVSRSLRAEGGEVHLNDLKNEATTDASFILTVQTITFTGPAAVTAKQYIQVVNAYVNQLTIAVDHYGYYSSNIQEFRQLADARQVLALQLRQELDLPAPSCTVLRP